MAAENMNLKISYVVIYVRECTCMEKIYFALLTYTNPGGKECLKSTVGLLRAELTCTKKCSLIDRLAGSS